MTTSCVGRTYLGRNIDQTSVMAGIEPGTGRCDVQRLYSVHLHTVCLFESSVLKTCRHEPDMKSSRTVIRVAEFHELLINKARTLYFSQIVYCVSFINNTYKLMLFYINI